MRYLFIGSLFALVLAVLLRPTSTHWLSAGPSPSSDPLGWGAAKLADVGEWVESTGTAARLFVARHPTLERCLGGTDPRSGGVPTLPLAGLASIALALRLRAQRLRLRR
jgi:hypothetical protein